MLVGPNIIVQGQTFLGAGDILYSTQVWVESEHRSFPIIIVMPALAWLHVVAT